MSAHDATGQGIHRIERLFGIPDFVKNAAVDQLTAEQPEGRLCGDVRTKEYPCHTAPATWLSTAYYCLDKQAGMPRDRSARIEKRLRQAGNYFGLNSDLDALFAKAAAVARTTEPQASDYGLTSITPAGETEQHYPLRNAREVKTAAIYAVKHRDSFTAPERLQLARAILEKAAEFNCVLDNKAAIDRLAGYGFAPVEKVASFALSLAKAARAKHDLNTATELAELATTIVDDASCVTEPERREKLAALLDSAAASLGVDRRAEDVVFDITADQVDQTLDDELVLTSGNVYSRDEVMEKLATEDLLLAVGNGGPSLVSDNAELVAVLPALNYVGASRFDRIAKQAGLAPIAQQAPEAPAGFNSYLRELAHLAE